MAILNKPMTTGRAIGVIGITIALGALIGGSLGWGIGTYMPEYYYNVFRTDSPGFDPIEVGIALGLLEGVVGGLIVGIVVVGVLTWQHVRLMQMPPAKRQTERIQKNR